MQGWFECRRVLLVGRRGPVQAACTAKELREIVGKLFEGHLFLSYCRSLSPFYCVLTTVVAPLVASHESTLFWHLGLRFYREEII